MSIIFNKEKGQFYLHTANTSYIIELLNSKIPMHAYWGKRLNNMPTLVEKKAVFAGNLPVIDVECEYPFFTTSTLPMEFPCYGTGDMREPAFSALYKDGSRITTLEYVSHTINEGKPKIKGLPATYGDSSEVSSLEIKLADNLTGLIVYLNYSVFEEKDAITRSVRMVNNSKEAVTLGKISSAAVDFYDTEFVVMHLHGDTNREFDLERNAIPYGVTFFDSKCGKTGHLQNPFAVLCRPQTTEDYGDAYGFSLIYSGNFKMTFEKNSADMIRVLTGINDHDFAWQLKSGEAFQTPEAVMVYSADGIGGMSRIFHNLYRNNLCRGKFKKSHRPIIINNWEATYFNFTEEKIAGIAEKARELGMEMLVLDDGWFGKRDSDASSLGDWYPNKDKLSNGLKGICDKVRSFGIEFGIWMEPEMVSPDSDLFRAHPDWCIHVNGRKPGLSRNQLVLDLSRKDVQDYIIDAVKNVLNSADISYLKWDMNRCLADLCSDLLAPQNQQELAHRYVLGLYHILDNIVDSFPEILFENCSSGGGRFDPGMMYYMPQTWCSDDSDAVERVFIQYGASMVYPPSSISAHVSVCPNHQVGRTTPIKMRGDVAASGRLGYELDLTQLTREDTKTIKEQIAFYNKYEAVINDGAFYRICSPYDKPYAAWQFISEDKNTVIMSVFVIKGKPSTRAVWFKLQSLDNESQYKNIATGEIVSGSYLMNVGLSEFVDRDYFSSVNVFEKI